MARLNKFDPGQMRHRVDIQQPIDGAQDTTTGATAITWTALATGRKIPAKISPSMGKEFWQGQQIQDTITHTVIMRHRSDVTAKMRLVFGTRVLSIQGPPQNWDELGQWMVLRCTEGANLG